MKTLVALKQVPSRDSLLRVDGQSTWIDETALSYEINEPDAYALEEGLEWKEKNGGEVVALTVGPPRAAQALREALAKGADRAVHVEHENLAAQDPLQLARLMAEAIRPEQPDLILTGLQSDDMGYGQTGVVLAELLGLPHATIIMDVQPANSGIRVKRELESGWFQHVEMPLPALLTIQSGIKRLRYATLMGIKKAKTKEMRRVTAAFAAGTNGLRLTRIYPPARNKQTQLFTGDVRQAAAQLAERLRREVRVL
jgi:electron transfer flavoprotein beta subunit